MPFTFKEEGMKGLFTVESKVFTDSRGYFFEGFKQSEFLENGIKESFCQSNFSLSSKGTLRGLHFQLNPCAQGKLVHCVKGSIFDLVVDIRKGSPSYGEWASFELSPKKKKFLYCPPGFAHGFQALEEDTLVMYFCSNEYSPKDEAGIIWDDPDLKVPWPISSPIITEKDQQFPPLKENQGNFVFEG